MKKLLFALAFALALPAWADENVIIKTPNGDSAMDETNDAVRVNIIAGAGSGGDGKILDGTGAGEADVFNYTNSRPLAVRLTDTNGDYVAPGGGGGGTQYQVDAAAGGTDTGTLALVVRDDALATLTPADGDYTQLRTTSVGRLWTSTVIDSAIPAGNNNIGDVDVATIAAGNNNIGDVDVASIAAGNNNIGDVDVASSALPTGAATSANQTTQITALQLIDNLPLVDDAAFTFGTSSVAGLGCAASADTMDAGDIGLAICGTNRQLDVEAIQSGTWNIGTVTTVTTVSAVTAISNALPAGNNNIGDVDVATIAAGNNNIGDVDIASIAAGNNNIGDVDVATLPNVTIGTFPDNEPFNLAQVGGNAVVTGGVNGSQGVGGLAAVDAAVAGNPNWIGVRASEARPTEISADGDVVGIWGSRSGAIVNAPYGTEVLGTGQVSVTTSSTAIVAARVTRRSLIIQNHGTTDVFCMTGTATTGAGFRLKGTDGASISLPTADDVACIVASGSQTVSYAEVYEQ